jgi:hypothetical protein
MEIKAGPGALITYKGLCIMIPLLLCCPGYTTDSLQIYFIFSLILELLP